MLGNPVLNASESEAKIIIWSEDGHSAHRLTTMH